MSDFPIITSEEKRKALERDLFLLSEKSIDLKAHFKKTHPNLTEEEIDNLLWGEEKERLRLLEEEKKKKPKDEPSEFCKVMTEFFNRIGEDNDLTNETEDALIDRYPDIKEKLHKALRK